MNKLALLSAAGATLLLIGGAALAQTSDQPSTMGAEKSHMNNPLPSGTGPANPNAPAADKRNNPDQPGPATSSGSGTMSQDPTSENPHNTTEKK